MFADLTPAELGTLRSKLYSAGHQFSLTALALGHAANLLPPLSGESGTIWDERRRFVAAMQESYEIAQAAEAAEAA